MARVRLNKMCHMRELGTNLAAREGIRKNQAATLVSSEIGSCRKVCWWSVIELFCLLDGSPPWAFQPPLLGSFCMETPVQDVL